MRCFRLLALLLASHSLCACELIADFDRGKLDAGRPVDSGTPVDEPTDPADIDAGPVDVDAGE
jgi:hypothetical protein